MTSSPQRTSWSGAVRHVPWWRRGSSWLRIVIGLALISGAVWWWRQPREVERIGWYRLGAGAVFFDGRSACRVDFPQPDVSGYLPEWKRVFHPKDCRPARGEVRVGWYTWRNGNYLVPADGLPCRYDDPTEFRELAHRAVVTLSDSLVPELERAPLCVTPLLEPIAEGFVLYRRTLYLSDGAGHLCAYRDWEEYVEAGGANGTWLELDELPRKHELTGPCVPDAGS